VNFPNLKKNLKTAIGLERWDRHVLSIESLSVVDWRVVVEETGGVMYCTFGKMMVPLF